MEYTVLIVEDNQIALESLRRTIPWLSATRLISPAEERINIIFRISSLITISSKIPVLPR